MLGRQPRACEPSQHGALIERGRKCGRADRVTHGLQVESTAIVARCRGPTVGILPRVAGKGARDAVVRAARSAGTPDDEPYEKDGETIVGWLAFTFSADGSLTRVVPTTEPFVCPP